MTALHAPLTIGSSQAQHRRRSIAPIADRGHVMQQEASGADAPDQFRFFLDDPGLTALLDYWCVLRRQAGGRVPPRRALDPMAVRKLLPRVEVWRRIPDGRLRCCLSGTAIRNETGRECTGRYLDELLPETALANRAALFLRALETGRPVAYRCPLPVPGRAYKATTRLLLPLLDDQGEATILVSMIEFRLRPLGALDVDPSSPPQALGAEETELAPGTARCSAAA